MKANKNSIDLFDGTDLSKPGDKASARITKTGRKVLTIEKENGTQKYSATQYSNGTIVETRTTKCK